MLIQPSMVSLLALQSFITLKVLLCTLSKLQSNCSSLLLILSPRRVNSFSNSKDRWVPNFVFYIEIISEWDDFFLSRNAWRPEILLNFSMYLTQARSEMIHLWINNDVSSAKVWALISSSVSRVIPLICLLLVILIRRISTAMITSSSLV